MNYFYRAIESLNLVRDPQTREMLEDMTQEIPAEVQALLKTHKDLQGSMYFI